MYSGGRCKPSNPSVTPSDGAAATEWSLRGTPPDLCPTVPSNTGPIMSTTVVQHPAGVSSAHACERCEQFVVHLDESLGEGRQSDLKKVIPNQSQRRLAERIFGAQDDLPGDLKDLKRNIFFEATYGYSLFDVDLEELRRYSREGCSLSSHLMRCMDDRRISLWDLPPKSVLGLKVLNAHSVEFGLLFVQSWSWILFKPFHDPDKFTMLAFPGVCHVSLTASLLFSRN